MLLTFAIPQAVLLSAVWPVAAALKFHHLPLPLWADYTQGEPESQAAYRANAVKQTFQIAWDGYYQYAFPNDELLPVNNSFANTL